MKLRNIQLHTLISLLLSLLLLLAALPSGWAEGDPIQDPQAGIGEILNELKAQKTQGEEK